jgi:uncharacterized membrane protein YhhN
MKTIFLLMFILAGLLEIISQVLGLSNLHHIVKPLLMIALGLYYFYSLSSEDRSRLVLLAIFFSFLGDSFLMYESKNPLYFMMGLGSFLFAHLVYIFCFRQHRDDEADDQLGTVQKARMAFPVILAATGLVVVLYPRLGELRLPVVLYAGTLMFMVLNALFRFNRTHSESFWMVFGGAVSFLISDSILAINKFLEPMPGAGVYIMVTYILAQYLIVQGIINHTRA